MLLRFFSQLAQDQPPKGFFERIALSPSTWADILAWINAKRFSTYLSIDILSFLTSALSTNFLVLLLIANSTLSIILSINLIL
jgi:hypothetical protein